MLRLTVLLLALMVTATPFWELTCFAAAVQGDHNPDTESRDLELVHSRSVSARRGKYAWCTGGSGWYDCYTEFGYTHCAINKTTGEYHRGCVKPSECPAAATGFKIVCDSTSDLCCCKADAIDPNEIKSEEMGCNDLWHERYELIYKQACSLPELSQTDVCKKSQTTPKPIFYCARQEVNGNRTEDTCTDSYNYSCGIDKKTGNAVGCVLNSDCPRGAEIMRGGLECDGAAGYCCCRGDEGKNARCNDVFSEEDDWAWKRACEKPELRRLWICKKSWTTTSRPPPTPPHPPTPGITAKNMSKHCLDYCIAKAPSGNSGPFDLFCGNPVQGHPTWNCPLPCPIGCDRYCPDGKNLKCPKLPEQRSGPGGQPGTNTGNPSQPPGPPAPFLDEEEDKEGLSLAVIIGVVALILILVVAAYCIWCKKRRQVQPQQASMMTLNYPGTQPNSATSVSSSLSGNLSSSSSVQMTPQQAWAQQPRQFQQMPQQQMWQQGYTPVGYPQPR